MLGDARTATKKLLFMAVGMLIQSSGVYLLLGSGFGLAPIALLNKGLATVFHVSYGSGALISGISCLLIVVLWCRKYVNVGTFIITFSFGILVDVVSAFYNLFMPLPWNFAMKLVYFAVGTLLINYGLGLVVATRIGAGSVEALELTIAFKTGFPFKWCKVGFEVAAAVAGFLMVMPENIMEIIFGTAFLAFASGPMVAHGIKLADRFILNKIGIYSEAIK